MTTVTVKESDIPPLTEEEIARLNALANLPDEEIDLSDMPELTDEDWARAVRVCDYSSPAEAREVARELGRMQKAGKSINELKAYRASRMKRPAAEPQAIGEKTCSR